MPTLVPLQRSEVPPPLHPCGTPDLQPHSAATNPSNTSTILEIHQNPIAREWETQ